MQTSRRRWRGRWGLAALTVSGLVGGAFFAGQAWAGGAPPTGALTYAGVLRDGSGTPLVGSPRVEIKLWSAAQAGDALCSSGLQTPGLQEGKFAIGLPDNCADAVKASPDVWVEVIADGVSLGRSKVGAVPYALEAAHASAADVAARAESLSERGAADFATAAHGHELTRCSVVEGVCGLGTFNQPTFFLDRVRFLCPEARPVMRGFRYGRCGELGTRGEGMHIVATCCAIGDDPE